MSGWSEAEREALNRWRFSACIDADMALEEFAELVAERERQAATRALEGAAANLPLRFDDAHSPVMDARAWLRIRAAEGGGDQ